MAWRTARLVATLALGGLGCGRTELLLEQDTEIGTTAGTASTGGTAGLDTGFDTGRPTTGLDTGGFDSGSFDTGGPITVTATFTSGLDSGGLDTFVDSGVLDTGLPTSESETSTSGSSSTTTTTTTTATSGPDTDGGTNSGGTTDGGTTSGGTTDGGTTSGGTTDSGTTSGGTTDGGTTDGGTTDGGGDPTCLDAVDCVLACGGASFTCIGQCNDGLSPADNAAFNDLETCIIFACIFNGSCGFDFEDPDCVACRIDGQLDPAPLGCDDEAAACF